MTGHLDHDAPDDCADNNAMLQPFLRGHKERYPDAPRWLKDTIDERTIEAMHWRMQAIACASDFTAAMLRGNYLLAAHHASEAARFARVAASATATVSKVRAT